MNNFTKKYIELCKNEKIQELRPEWQMGDFMYYFDGTIDVMHPKLDNGTPIWLPTGDQLDEEIIKICKEKEYYYTISYSFAEQDYLWTTIVTPEKQSPIITNNSNPLIAKLKLLLQLMQ